MDNISSTNISAYTKKRARHVSLDSKKAMAGYLFVLPFLVGILFVYLPILIDSITYSFTNLNKITLPGEIKYSLSFAGFSHYQNAFVGHDSKFLETLITGLQNLIFEVPAIVIFSLFIAVVLNQKMLGRAAFRAIFFVPVIIATGIMEGLTDLTANNAANQMQGAAGGADAAATTGGASQIISVLDVQSLLSTMKVGAELVTYVVELVNNIYNIIYCKFSRILI